MPDHRISRRSALGIVGLGALAACAGPGSEVTSSSAPSGPPSRMGATTVPLPVGGSDAVIDPPEPATTGPRRYRYGTDPSQWAELHLPYGSRRPGTVVVIHGGFWSASFGADLCTPIAADLAGRGWAVWNVEYRRVGDGGGWPATFDDIAGAIDHLAAIEVKLDLDRVIAVGHSAGGQLAAWAASRPGLPVGAPGTGPKVPVTGVVSQAGVLDLAMADSTGLGGGAVADLLGGTAAEVPERYRMGSPTDIVAAGMRIRCVHSPTDGIVPLDQSQRYVTAAGRVGADATLTTVPGDHFDLITPGTPAWLACVEAVGAL